MLSDKNRKIDCLFNGDSKLQDVIKKLILHKLLESRDDFLKNTHSNY